MRHSCKKVGGGVLYVYVPDDYTLLSREIGSVIEYDFQPVTFWSQVRKKYFGSEGVQCYLLHEIYSLDRPQPSELAIVLDAISKASYRFRNQHSRPAVLVIDNLTVLAKEDPETFKRLVRFAKYEADQRSLVVNFVSSEGHTPRKLLGMMALFPTY